jgi:hypothetical protein
LLNIAGFAPTWPAKDGSGQLQAAVFLTQRKGEFMETKDKIDASRFLAQVGIRAQTGGRAESEGVSRQSHPVHETLFLNEKEHIPDYYEWQESGPGQKGLSYGQ